jgi:hypothetical protein
VVSRGKTGCEEPVFGDVATRRSWLVGEAIAVANRARELPPSWAPCTADNQCLAATSEEPATTTEPDATCSMVRRRAGFAGAWPLALCALVLALRRRAAR